MPAGRGRRLPKIKSYFEGRHPKNSLSASAAPPPQPSLLSSLNMDNDCLRLQNHKSEVPIATEQLARLPIIIIINHADFTVFSGTAGDCTGQGTTGASGAARQAGKGREACRSVWDEEEEERECVLVGRDG